jgi:hypothetical protein
MSDPSKLIGKPGTWNTEFEARLAAYQKLIDQHREKEKAFELERQAEFEKLRESLHEQLQGPRDQLFEVAPIFEGDIEAIPTRRAAYSDRTAALMAKLSMLTYVAFEDAEKKSILENLLTHGRVRLLETLHIDETEALVADTEKFVVVAFRGTTSKVDLRTDLQARFNVKQVEVETRKVRIPVHSGFHGAYMKIDALLAEHLEKTDPAKPIYLTGHSLGGALALVGSAVLGGSAKLGDRLAAVYTFGAPRVGPREFARIVKAPHYRVVNKGDVVPLVPPTWLRGYAHTGTPIFLKEGADTPIRRAPWGSAFWLTLQSVLLWPFTRRLLFLRQHETSLYVANLDRIARYRGKWS